MDLFIEIMVLTLHLLEEEYDIWLLTSWTTDDIVGVAIDFDSGKIWYAKKIF